MVISYNGRQPRIGENAFIAPTAVIIGDVEIADGASIWYGTVLRGDMEPIRIGAGTSIQDNSTVHTEQGHPVEVGAGVTVGHNAVSHGCIIENRCLIGIGALVLSGAVIGRGSVVAAGAVVREGQVVEPGMLLAGVPAVAKRRLTGDEQRQLLQAGATYAELSRAHRALIDSDRRDGG